MVACLAKLPADPNKLDMQDQVFVSNSFKYFLAELNLHIIQSQTICMMHEVLEATIISMAYQVCYVLQCNAHVVGSGAAGNYQFQNHIRDFTTFSFPDIPMQHLAC